MAEQSLYSSLQQTREAFLHRFLFICLCVLSFYLVFDLYHHLYAGALTDLIAGLAIGVSYFSLRRQGLKDWHIQLTLLGGIALFGPLLIVDAFGDTGIYWLPTLPVLCFMLAGTRLGLIWTGLYLLLLLLTIVLGNQGVLQLLYSWEEIVFIMFVTIFMGIISYAFVRYLEAAERTLLLQQERLEQALEQAQVGSKAKSLFLSTMSHELRTPLHGIIGLQELLREDNGAWTDEQREYLGLSLHASKVLKDLLNDVLDLAKIEASEMKVDLHVLDLKKLTHDSLLPFVFNVKEKGVLLDLEMDDVPRYIIADQIHLRQILFNLLGNAVKFTEKGSVRLLVQKDPDTEHQLVFSVKDTGVGIPADELPYIFEAFHQCSNSDHEIKGTGLGTSIIKQTVELMGGRVEVESELGQGSCFKFTLPYQNMDSENFSFAWGTKQAIEPKAAQVQASISNSHAPLPLNILLVEDDVVAQRIAEKTLKRAGMHVDVANHGEAALALLKHHTYDVMLTDLRMPCMDGITLTRAVRKRENPAHPRMLIIGLSAHALSSVIDEAMQAGMDEFLLKPIEPDMILACIRKTQRNVAHTL